MVNEILYTYSMIRPWRYCIVVIELQDSATTVRRQQCYSRPGLVRCMIITRIKHDIAIVMRMPILQHGKYNPSCSQQLTSYRVVTFLWSTVTLSPQWRRPRCDPSHANELQRCSRNVKAHDKNHRKPGKLAKELQHCILRLSPSRYKEPRMLGEDPKTWGALGE